MMLLEAIRAADMALSLGTQNLQFWSRDDQQPYESAGGEVVCELPSKLRSTMPSAGVYEGKCLRCLPSKHDPGHQARIEGLSDEAATASGDCMENNINRTSSCRKDHDRVSSTVLHDLTWSSESMSSCSSASGGSLLLAGSLCRCPA